MKTERNIIIAALSLAGLLSQSALADKPEWAGKHSRGKGEHAQQQDAGRQDYRSGDAQLNISLSFSSHDRQILSDYYQSQQRAGHCPPGLAKKNAQCMPPGQLKKWQRGQALPGDLRYNELPPDIYRRLAPLPAGHRYVTIAGDVLIIATATRMVIDAVEDLLR